eukprot:gene14676-16206_t
MQIASEGADSNIQSVNNSNMFVNNKRPSGNSLQAEGNFEADTKTIVHPASGIPVKATTICLRSSSHDADMEKNDGPELIMLTDDDDELLAVKDGSTDSDFPKW